MRDPWARILHWLGAELVRYGTGLLYSAARARAPRSSVPAAFSVMRGGRPGTGGGILTCTRCGGTRGRHVLLTCLAELARGESTG